MCTDAGISVCMVANLPQGWWDCHLGKPVRCKAEGCKDTGGLLGGGSGLEVNRPGEGLSAMGLMCWGGREGDM